MLRTQRPSLPWLGFALALLASCWMLSVTWRGPELLFLHNVDVGPHSWNDTTGRLQDLLVGAPIVLVRCVALALYAAAAIALGKLVRAATGYGLAPAVEPLLAIAMLALPLAPQLVLDVRALPWLFATACLLTGLTLALAPLDDERLKAKRVLANVLCAAALMPLGATLATLLMLAALLFLVVPHRDRHPLGLVQTPLIGFGLGLWGSSVYGNNLAPYALTAGLSAPFAVALLVALGLALVLALRNQRPYRQSLLTLVGLAAILFASAPHARGAALAGMLAATLALGITFNVERARGAALQSFALVVGAGAAAHASLVPPTLSTSARTQAFLAVAEEAIPPHAAALATDLTLLVEPTSDHYTEKAHAWLPLGTPTRLGPELLFALDFDELPQGPVGPPRIALEAVPESRLGPLGRERAYHWGIRETSHQSPAFPRKPPPEEAALIRRDGLTVRADFEALAPRPPSTVNPDNSLRTQVVVLAHFEGDALVVDRDQTLDGYPLPFGAIHAEPVAKHELRFSPPLPVHHVMGLQVAFRYGAYRGTLVVHLGDPLSADHRTVELVIDLPENPDPTFELIPGEPYVSSDRAVYVPLPSDAEALFGPGIHGVTFEGEGPELVRCRPESVPPRVGMHEPLPGWELDMTPGAPQPRFRTNYWGGWLEAERCELDFKIFAPERRADGTRETWDLLALGPVLSTHAQGYAEPGPMTLGARDPALASARRPWQEFVAEGLGQQLARRGALLDAELRMHLYGPGDLLIGTTDPVDIKVRTAATP